MKRIPTCLVAIFLASGATEVAQAQSRPARVPNISGTWYMNGDPYQPCQVIQRRLDSNAYFINEHGSGAWAVVVADQVWIPEWSDGRQQGLLGLLRGNRIVWPNGTFWSR